MNKTMPGDEDIENSTELLDGKKQRPGSPSFRVRCFPRAHLSTPTPTLSRRSTAVDAVALRSSDSVCDQSLLFSAVHNPTTNNTNAEPYMTVFYPTGANDSDAAEQSLLLQYRHDNVGRAQVRVEGYFQHDDDALGVLIPNDLPRSTVLYVLTASEGRDKLFKCLQYGLQALMCFLKHPRLFSPEVQGFAEYWAERFWRNANTIRHGRSLFKLGRWITNIFYLEEVCERLALKHGHAARDAIRSLRAAVMQLLPEALVRHIRPANGGAKNMTDNPSGLSLESLNAAPPDSLVTDDMYSYVARVECRRQPKLSLLSPVSASHETKKGKPKNSLTGGEATALGAFLPNGAALTSGKQDILQRRSSLGRQRQKEDALQEEEQKHGHQGGEAANGSIDGGAVLKAFDESSPPFVKSTFPSSLLADGRSRASKVNPAPLLHPLRSPPNEASESTEKSAPNNVGNKSGTTQEFFTTYPVLPYVARLGDALPSVAVRPSVCVGSNEASVMQSIHHGNNLNSKNNFLLNGGSPVIPMDDGDYDPYDLRYGTLNDSDVSLSSSVTEASKDDQLLPASVALPAHWRKHFWQFSTPLMLLLGVRSAATIGRRIMRDVLLLSSEHFLNVSYVEQNRPSLQRRSNWLWLIVSCIDLFLNTVRLMDKGWYKYATARQSTKSRCRCANDDARDIMWRSRGFVARRKTDLFFPPLDLDFGAPISSSLAFFEAADPEHMAPACESCGCLFIQDHYMKGKGHHQNQKVRSGNKEPWIPHAGQNGGDTSGNGHDAANTTMGGVERMNPRSHSLSIGDRAEVAILLVPWVMRKLFNYLWLLRTHPNWNATILLQIRYMAEVYLAFKYCFGGFETGKSDASLMEMLHPSGAIAGLLSAVISLRRVMESAPK